MPTNETNLRSLSIQDNYEAFVILEKYMNNELSAEVHTDVSHALQRCEDCRMMYNDMKLFFNESENILYELIHPDEVEDSRNILSEPINDPSLMDITKANQQKKINIPSSLLEGECFCCGA